ncbi:MAG: RNA 3'-terminal phosphate cyclase [Hahellaceae bacterium]|nr:RNA 3'-terminal phosphate cyclase [Hahellaceae bacterium]MCP5210285.1 RNA 3'-terminal phosphate cyclase [Hahellaceae bacterium]
MKKGLIEIDGSKGEGGGQILRTSLTLSMLYGLPLSLKNIRGRRPKPGLMRQHLTCVQAAQAICNAKVTGDSLGSQSLTFTPGEVSPGDFRFDVGSAGSTTLVFQTIFLPLLNAAKPSSAHFTGGTHNPMAPPLTFLEESFLPLIRQMGAAVTIDTQRWGFMPAGGGMWSAAITPSTLQPATLTTRPPLNESRVTSYISGLRGDVAQREIQSYLAHGTTPNTKTAVSHPEAACAGNLLCHTLDFGNYKACFSTLGQRRLSAENVAFTLAKEVKNYLAHQAVLCEHMTDQIMLPMLVAGGGCFSAGKLSLHATTNRDLIAGLTGKEIKAEVKGTVNLLTL